MEDVIRLLEQRRRLYNEAIDRAIRALRSAPTEAPEGGNAPQPARRRERARPVRATARKVSRGRAAPAATPPYVMPGSILEKSLAILRQRGRLHAKDIVAALGLAPGRKQTVVSALERGIPRGAIRRPAPGTYEAGA